MWKLPVVCTYNHERENRIYRGAVEVWCGLSHKKMTQEKILHLIAQDHWMMDILRVVRDLHLPDSWVGAGFVRGKVWDHLHGFTQRTPLPDVDVIYYDIDYPEESFEQEMEAKLRKQRPEVKWSVTNQARMHVLHGDRPYRDTSEAMSKWPETCTAVAVRLAGDDSLELLAPWGIEDMVNMRVRPTPAFEQRMDEFRARQTKKQWPQKWPKIKLDF